MSVMPTSAANSAASDDGADTAASTGMPAIIAFWASSKLARLDTISTVPVSGSRFSFSAQPITLSTALCRPTSSRSTSISPVAPSNSAAAWSPPVFSNTVCRVRNRSGNEVSSSASTRTGSSITGKEDLVRTASMLALPQRPQELVVRNDRSRLGSGGLTPGARDTSSTL